MVAARTNADRISGGTAAAASPPLVASPKPLAERALAMVTVPLAALAPPALGVHRSSGRASAAAAEKEVVDGARAGSTATPRQRPQRQRFPPLEAWRNERVVYCREPGSPAPGVAALQLNLAPRPDRAPPRDFGCTGLQVPDSDSVAEIVGLSSERVDSRVFTLMARPAGRRPHVVLLQPTRGLLYVLEGRARVCEGDHGEVELEEGDTAVFQGRASKVLVAPALPGRGVGVRFRWVAIRRPAAAAEQPPPLQDVDVELASSRAAGTAAA